MFVVSGMIPAKEVLPGNKVIGDFVSLEVCHRPNVKVDRHGGLGQMLIVYLSRAVRRSYTNLRAQVQLPESKTG